MVKKYWMIAAILMLSASLLILTSAKASAAKPIELRFNYSMPAKTPPSNGWEWFGKELEKRSGGRFKVTYFPHGGLFKVRHAVENIVSGTADIANISIRTYAKRYPLTAVTLIPTIPWPNTVEGTHASARAIMTLIDEFPGIQKELKDFKVIWVQQLTSYNLFTTKEVKKPSDLKGMKIGAGGVQGAFVTQQGGSGVAIVPPKSYMSMKTGVVDGMVMSFNACNAYKLWEVANNVLVVAMGRVPLPIVMNLGTWNSLPPDIQKMVLDIGDESLPMAIRGMLDTGKVGRKRFIEAGKKVYEPSKAEADVWYKAFQPLEEQWLADCKKKGLEEAPKVLEFYKAAAAAAWK